MSKINKEDIEKRTKAAINEIKNYDNKQKPTQIIRGKTNIIADDVDINITDCEGLKEEIKYLKKMIADKDELILSLLNKQMYDK